MRHRARVLGVAVTAAAWALILGACASGGFPGELAPVETSAEATTPLGGESLAQRKQEMQRAHGDMGQFHATLKSLHHRRDRNGFILFGKFLNAYMGQHLDPLLASAWQARHPELMALDANLRFVKAEVLIQMRAPRRVQAVIDEIETRFAGRESMLVEYPMGHQGTLGEGLEALRERKWRG